MESSALRQSERDGAPGLTSEQARFAFAALLLCLLVHYGLVRLEGPLNVGTQRTLAGDEKRYVEVATDWSRGRFTELDPLWPPGYSAILAAVLALGGTPAVLQLLQFLALVASGWVLSRIALHLSVGPPFAAVAGTWILIDPQVAVFARLFRPEALHLAIFMIALLWAIELQGEIPLLDRSKRLVGLGTLLGVAVALKSLLLPFLPLILGASVRRAPGFGRRRQAVLFAIPCVLLLAGLAGFHKIQSGSWTLGGSARFNLWVGLTDSTARSLAGDRTWNNYLEYRAAGETFEERQAFLDQRLDALAREVGLWKLLTRQFPRQYYRLFDRESYFAAMLPPSGSRFLIGEGYRAESASLAKALGGFEVALYGILIALAPFGLIRLMRSRRHTWQTIGPLLFGQLALFWFVHVKSRYRLTLLPLLVLGVAFAVETLTRSEERAAVTGAEIAFGLAGTAALSCVAFGGG